MTKNVAVFDSEGKLIGTTYPKRAEGLIKNGRARRYAGLDTAIILASSPETDFTSQEDEIMSNYNNEELRERIESLMRETKEKVDAVCRTAADAIDDLVEKIDGSDDVTEDEEIFIDMDMDGETPSEGEQHGHWISDENLEKLKAKMAGMRESISRVTEEVKAVAVKTGAEIGKYADTVKTKVSEKLAEREAESESKAESARAGSEAYYLEKIAEIHEDKAYIENAFEKLSLAYDAGDMAGQDIAQAIGNMVVEREQTNRQMLNFYMGQLSMIQSKSGETEMSARERLDAEHMRKEETPAERRARLISNDPMIKSLLTTAADNPGDPAGALAEAANVVERYIKSVYGDAE